MISHSTSPLSCATTEYDAIQEVLLSFSMDLTSIEERLSEPILRETESESLSIDSSVVKDKVRLSPTLITCLLLLP